MMKTVSRARIVSIVSASFAEAGAALAVSVPIGQTFGCVDQESIAFYENLTHQWATTYGKRTAAVPLLGIPLLMPFGQMTVSSQPLKVTPYLVYGG